VIFSNVTDTGSIFDGCGEKKRIPALPAVPHICGARAKRRFSPVSASSYCKSLANATLRRFAVPDFRRGKFHLERRSVVLSAMAAQPVRRSPRSITAATTVIISLRVPFAFSASRRCIFFYRFSCAGAFVDARERSIIFAAPVPRVRPEI